MLDCLQGRELVMKHQVAAENKILTDKKTVETLKANKTTITNFWKSKATKATQAVNMEGQIEVIE